MLMIKVDNDTCSLSASGDSLEDAANYWVNASVSLLHELDKRSHTLVLRALYAVLNEFEV